MTKCVATGCTLVDLGAMRHAHGDLHLVGDVYVFNSCLTDKGETRWQYEDMFTASKLATMTILEGTNYFEKRGVIVFDTRSCVPNERMMEKLDYC